MKSLLNLLLILFIFQTVSAQENSHADENGNALNKKDYYAKWRNKDLSYSTWLHVNEKGITHHTLKQDLFLKGVFKYEEIKTQMETLLNRKIPDSNTILIEYRYKDDLCTSRWDNTWTQVEIIDRKNFLDPLRRDIERKNITYIVLFEAGMTLKNNPRKKNEYFFIDNENYFRNKLFKSPTLCGSFALIKSNGQVVIRNGEHRADMMAKLLNNEIWAQFFNVDH